MQYSGKNSALCWFYLYIYTVGQHMDKSPSCNVKVMSKMIWGNEMDTASQVEFELYAP
jgi:hypothetical protein